VRMLFAAIGAYGHVYPLLPLMQACADAGHEVVLATGEPFLGRLPLTTVPGYLDLGLDAAVAETRRRHPERTGPDLSMAMFADVVSEYAVPALLAECRRSRPDLIVYEAMHAGAGVVANLLDVPAAAFAIALGTGFFSQLHGETVRFRQALWAERGRIAPAGDTLLADVVISPVPPSLRDGRPIGAVLPIRSVAYDADELPVPGWLSRPADRPRVYLTLGTVSFGAVEVIRRAVEEISALDVDLLVAVGPEGEPAAVGPTSDNVHVERFVPQAAVLPLVDVVVHHGGTGTVLGALAAGRPQLLLPQGADQFDNAVRLAAVGAARALLPDQWSPGAAGAAVGQLLGSGPERRVAEGIADEIAAMPPPADVVPSLLELTR
jgi:UDP:flavonoid glycosyltransferase YjiC (YdhE family)